MYTLGFKGLCFLKEIDTSVHQGCINLIKSDGEDGYK